MALLPHIHICAYVLINFKTQYILILKNRDINIKLGLTISQSEYKILYSNK